MTVLIEKDVDCPMRDGVVLRCDVYRPSAAGKHPALLQRVPYNKSLLPAATLSIDPIRAAQAGYAVVIQDQRGTWASEGGPFMPFVNDFDDGYDSVQWVADQPWCDGNVGMYGASNMGACAWQAAAAKPPALKTIIPTTSPYDLWEYLWRQGALELGHLVYWSLLAMAPGSLLRQHGGKESFVPRLVELADSIDLHDERVYHLPINTFPPAHPEDESYLPAFFELLKHPAPDDFTRNAIKTERFAGIEIPVLIIAGWHDMLLREDLKHFARSRNSRIIIGPWGHAAFTSLVGERDFGIRASGALLDLAGDLTALHLRWFDRWLKGNLNGVDEDPVVKVFVQGHNRFRSESSWPIQRAVQRSLYLNYDNGLSWEKPSGYGESDSFVYDPTDPCPTAGGSLIMMPAYSRGPVDQRRIVARDDVLTYRSEPLEDTLEIGGEIRMILHASSTAPDTDWVVKLCEEFVDGRVLNVSDGIVRASYRDGPGSGALRSGQVERYEIELNPSCYEFERGSRIVILVTSSDFPRWDRNLNTGESGIASTEMVTAIQTIYYEDLHASHIVLPVIPASSA